MGPLYFGSMGQGISDARDKVSERALTDLRMQMMRQQLEESMRGAKGKEAAEDWFKGVDIQSLFGQPQPEARQGPPQIPPMPGTPSQPAPMPPQAAGPTQPPPGAIPPVGTMQPQMPPQMPAPGGPPGAPGGPGMMPGGPPQVPQPGGMPPGGMPGGMPQPQMRPAGMNPGPPQGAPPGPGVGGPAGPAPGPGGPGMPPQITPYLSPNNLPQRGGPAGAPQLPPMQRPPEPGSPPTWNVKAMLESMQKSGVPLEVALDMVKKFEGALAPEQLAQIKLMEAQRKWYDEDIKNREQRSKEQNRIERESRLLQLLPFKIQQTQADTELKRARVVQVGKKSIDISELSPDGREYRAYRRLFFGERPAGYGAKGVGERDQTDSDAAKLAQEMGINAAEAASMPAEKKADALSLLTGQKKLDAIQGQLNSFHNNMKTWDELARGIAPSIGSEQAKALSGQLSRIDFSDVKSFNDVKLRVLREINDPTAAAYAVGAMAVAMDYARIQTGPQSAAQLTEGARNDAMRLIAAGLDDKARGAVLGALDSDAVGQVKGLQDQINAIKGRLSGAPPRTTGKEPKKITSDAEYDALPKGSEFIGPDGKKRKKP